MKELIKNIKTVVKEFKNSDCQVEQLLIDFLKERDEKQLNLNLVTGSIGKDTKPVLTTLKRTYENKDICVCDLCILKDKCTDLNEVFQNCTNKNTDDQYYL